MKKNSIKGVITRTDYNMEAFLKENLSSEMFRSILNLFYSPHLVLKIFLLGFLLLANSLASYTTVTLIQSYFEYNVNTLTRTIKENPVEFPKITVCNRNIFTT